MPPQIIPTSPGPEDMLLDTSSTSPRLIISCGDFFHTNKPTRAGGIYYYNISKDIVGEFHRIGIPGDIQFFPHGIAKHPKKNMLYVIIHDRSGIETGNNGIIIFNIEGDQLVFRKSFATAITSPHQTISLSPKTEASTLPTPVASNRNNCSNVSSSGNQTS
ncbi:MAG: hypothetical protein WDO15_00080 [Bacteroidota bacterium]